MSADEKLEIEHPQDLIDLCEANFGFGVDSVHKLVECIDLCGDVDTGVTKFVDSEFRDRMLIYIHGKHRHGKAATFDDYAKWVAFPYEEDAFREHLRAIWNESIGEQPGCLRWAVTFGGSDAVACRPYRLAVHVVVRDNPICGMPPSCRSHAAQHAVSSCHPARVHDDDPLTGGNLASDRLDRSESGMSAARNLLCVWQPPRRDRTHEQQA